jgi:hypothetical protein
MDKTDRQPAQTQADQDREGSAEDLRRQMVASTNARPGSREALAAKYGSVWNTRELVGEFKVLGFRPPFVLVRRKSDGRKGRLNFQHHPLFYFGFLPDGD